MKRIFRYLNGIKHLKLCFQANNLEVVGYWDTDFARHMNDSMSTLGHVFLFGGVAISWSSKKQTGVARYTQDAEHVACSIASTFVAWIKCFIDYLDLNIVNGSIQMYCDNESTIRFIKSGVNSPN